MHVYIVVYDIYTHYITYSHPIYTYTLYIQNNKLKLVHGTMLSAIHESTVPITVASLLDHMDWMTDGMINEEITAVRYMRV